MEEEPSDPYEQQLLAVYKSCLNKGHKELDHAGLITLCRKLELEQSHQDAIMQLLESNKTVTFTEFRDRFLALLGKSQQEITESELNGNFQKENLEESKGLMSQSNSSLTAVTESSCNRSSILSKQTIELIFEKLDIDCDGLINFTEFLRFFESANNKLQEKSLHNWSTRISTDNGKIEDKDFSDHHLSFISRKTIVDLWEEGGVLEANSLLLDLGFDMQTIKLMDLSNALTSEMKLHRDVSNESGLKEYVRLLKGTLILYQEEVRVLNTTMEHLYCERNKLRSDITEANERANLLAQEVDEHQTRMEIIRQEQIHQLEMRHCETVKDLTDQLHIERECSNNTLHSLERRLFSAQQEESRIRSELGGANDDIRALEKENHYQAQEIKRLQSNKSELAKRVRELAAEHEQVTNTESRENEEVVQLQERIKQLLIEISILRDHNDELTSEIESLKSIASGSSLDDNEKDKRNREKLNSVKDFLTLSTFCNNCAQLKSDISDLISEIEICTLTPNSQEIRLSKNATNLADELVVLNSDIQVKNRTNSCLELSSSCELNRTQKRISSSNETINDLKLLDNTDSAELRSYFKAKFALLPVKSTLEWKPTKDELLKESETKHAAEKKKLSEKINELERSLDLLRSEYDQCEEYWVAKLDEERQLFEQEQKISSDKFNDLLDKIAEYEISNKHSLSGRLTPIEESSGLEQQYADLEEEFDDWRMRAEEELCKREKELNELKIKFKEKNFVDEGVQCPDEIMKKAFPVLYNTLVNNNDGNNRTDITSSIETASASCDKCHKQKTQDGCKCDSTPGNSRDQKQSEPSQSQKFYQKPPSSYYHHRSNRYDNRFRNNYHHQHNPNLHYQQQHPYQHHKMYPTDRELRGLQRQKERLRHEILKLQSILASCPTGLDQHGIFSNLCAKLYAAEQRQKYIQVSYQRQLSENERIMQGMWKQYLIETEDLRHIIKNTENKLTLQLRINKDQMEKLTKADFLAKDLYVENAQMVETIKRLEQHCQILTKNSIDSTSSPS